MKKDEIYIDCQPVNSEGQTLVNYNLKKDIMIKGNTIDTSKIMNSPYLGVLLGALGFVVLLKVSKYIMKKL